MLVHWYRHALLQKIFSTVAVWHFIVLDYFAGMRYSLLCWTKLSLILLILPNVKGTQHFILVNGSCPDGWIYYSKHCYKFFSTSRQWAAAQFFCARYGANLISIHDDREQDFLMYFLQSKTVFNSFSIWTGLLKVSIAQIYISSVHINVHLLLFTACMSISVVLN